MIYNYISSFQVTANLPRWISGAFSYPVIESSEEGSVYYNVSLQGISCYQLSLNAFVKFFVQGYITITEYFMLCVLGLSLPWQAYSLDVEQTCKNDSTSNVESSVQMDTSSRKEHLGLLRLVHPWISDVTYGMIGKNKSNR